MLVAAFIWWECYFSYPLMPMSVWRDRDFSLVCRDFSIIAYANIIQLNMIIFLGFGSFAPMFFFVALYLQELSRYSALMTAVHLLPMAIVGTTVNVSHLLGGRYVNDIDDSF